MANAHVQSASAATGNVSAANIATPALGAGVGSGRLVCGFVQAGHASGVLTSVTDNASGNTYTIVDTFTDAANSNRIWTFYGKNIQNGPTIFTANFGASYTYRVIHVHEVSGADITDPLDKHAIRIQTPSPGTGTDAVASDSVTPATNGQYIFGGTVNTNALRPSTHFTAGTGFTNRQVSGGTVATSASESMVQATAAALSATFTQANSDIPVTLVMTFKEAASGQTVAIGQVTESDSVLALTSRKLKGLGLISETDSSQSVSSSKRGTLGINAETDLAQAVTSHKLRALGLVSETDLAQVVTRPSGIDLGLATESDLSQAVSVHKVKVISLVTESELAQVLAKAKLRSIGLAAELDIAWPFSYSSALTPIVPGPFIPPPDDEYHLYQRFVAAMVPRVEDLTGAINVMDCGAVGDGWHNDTPAFILALTIANGGRVYVPPGMYRCESLIHVGGVPMRLIGVDRDSTVLYFPTLGADGLTPTHYSEIAHLTLRGPGGYTPGYSLVDTGGVTGVTFYDVLLEDSGQFAINTGGNSSNWRLTDVLSRNHHNSGFFLAAGTSNCVLRNCLSTGNGNSGFDCNGSNNKYLSCFSLFDGGVGGPIDFFGFLTAAVGDNADNNLYDHCICVGAGQAGFTIVAHPGYHANGTNHKYCESYLNTGINLDGDGFSIGGGSSGEFATVGDTHFTRYYKCIAGRNQRYGFVLNADNGQVVADTRLRDCISEDNGGFDVAISLASNTYLSNMTMGTYQDLGVDTIISPGMPLDIAARATMIRPVKTRTMDRRNMSSSGRVIITTPEG